MARRKAFGRRWRIRGFWHAVLWVLLGANFRIKHLGDYMRRWVLQWEDGSTWRIHHLLRSDDDRAMHDHPAGFTSYILWGGYWEVTQAGKHEMKTWYGPGSVIRRPATRLHRIVLEPGTTAWTFVRMGRPWRTWGFMAPEGWVTEAEYKRRYPEAILESDRRPRSTK